MGEIIKIESSSHWYSEDGKPQHNADLRAARAAGYFPSPTSVLRLLANPGLEAWKVEQHMLSMATMPNPPADAGAWVRAAVVEFQEQRKKTLNTGSQIHKALENAIARKTVWGDPGDECLWKPVLAWLKAMEPCGECEKTLVHTRYGYAGRADLVGTINGVGPVIVDFKTQWIKDVYKRPPKNMSFFGKGAPIKVWCYPDWIWQLAAYQMADFHADQREFPRRCVSVVISTNPLYPGVAMRAWDEEEATAGFLIFVDVLNLFRRIKKLPERPMV